MQLNNIILYVVINIKNQLKQADIGHSLTLNYSRLIVLKSDSHLPKNIVICLNDSP